MEYCVRSKEFLREQAIDIIHNAGGLSLLILIRGHPGYRHTYRTGKLAEYGVTASKHTGECHPDHCDPYAHLARELGLFVTGGSDFHGDMKHQDTGTISDRLQYLMNMSRR